MSTNDRYPSFAQTAAALLIAASSVVVTGIQPVMVGTLLNEHRIEMVQVGQLAMTELLMLTVGIVVANVFQPLRTFRLVALITSLVGGVFNLATLVDGSAMELIALRAATGFTEGILVWIGTAVVVRAKAPSRLFAVSAILQLLTQGLLAALLSMVTIPAYGWKSVFVSLALISFFNAAMSLSLPRAITSLPLEGPSGFRWTPQHVQVLAVAFLQVAAMGALWAYTEPVGQSLGFSTVGIETLISFTLGAALLGAVAAMLTVHRWRPGLALVLSSAAMVTIALLIYDTPVGGLTRFSVLLVTFQIVSIFVIPFQAALAFDTDKTGRVATIVPLLQVLGQALGPLFSSWAVMSNDARPSLLACAAITCLAIPLMLRFTRRALFQAP